MYKLSSHPVFHYAQLDSTLSSKGVTTVGYSLLQAQISLGGFYCSLTDLHVGDELVMVLGGAGCQHLLLA